MPIQAAFVRHIARMSSVETATLTTSGRSPIRTNS